MTEIISLLESSDVECQKLGFRLFQETDLYYKLKDSTYDWVSIDKYGTKHIWTKATILRFTFDSFPEFINKIKNPLNNNDIREISKIIVFIIENVTPVKHATG